MIRLRGVTPLSMLLAGAVYFSAVTLSAQNAPAPNAPAPNTLSPAATASRATLDRFCIACHRGPNAVAGLHLDTFDTASFETNGATWEKMMRKLRKRERTRDSIRLPDYGTYSAH